MLKWTQGLVSLAASSAAWAVEEPVRSNTTATTWEIYGIVVLVFVVGFALVLRHQKKEKLRDQRKQEKSATS